MTRINSSVVQRVAVLGERPAGGGDFQGRFDHSYNNLKGR